MTCSKISSLDFNPGGWINMSQNAAAIQGSGRSPVSLDSEEAKYWEEREAAKAKALKLAAKAETAQRENYAKALKREKDREYQRRKAKKRKIQVTMLHLDDPRMTNLNSEDSPAWESDNGKGELNIRAIERAEAITIALAKLTPNDRAFAQAVLDGKSWRELGIPESSFYWRLKKIETFFQNSGAHPLKPSLDY